MRILCFCFTLIMSALYCSGNNVATVDLAMTKVPTNESKTADGLANYINSNFNTQEDKARAIYFWITRNIDYAIANMQNNRLYQNKDDVVKRALATRKGICMSYAELFNTLAEKTGLQSYPVYGYTKQNNKIDTLPHEWNALQINGKWYLLDATWGAGHVMNGKFVRQPGDSLFLQDPQVFIRSHMPFDPIWQLLDYVVTNQQFYDGNTQTSDKQRMNYTQEITQWLSQTEEEQLKTSAARIEANGMKNDLIRERLQQIRQNLDGIHMTQQVDLFNEAVKGFSNGIARMNEFIAYRNNQMTPARSQEETYRMLDKAETEFHNAQSILQQLTTTDTSTVSAIRQLRSSIDKALLGTKEQKEFLNQHFQSTNLQP